MIWLWSLQHHFSRWWDVQWLSMFPYKHPFECVNIFLRISWQSGEWFFNEAFLRVGLGYESTWQGWDRARPLHTHTHKQWHTGSPSFPPFLGLTHTQHVETSSDSADSAISNKNNSNNNNNYTSGFSAAVVEALSVVCMSVRVSSKGQKKNGQTETMAGNTIYIVLSSMCP